MQINFGWCKGDDNFGGRQRKELDDFTKSLGKQMTLVMYRMQDTENVRMRLREESRRRLREKFEKEEAEDKAKVREITKVTAHWSWSYFAVRKSGRRGTGSGGRGRRAGRSWRRARRRSWTRRSRGS